MENQLQTAVNNGWLPKELKNNIPESVQVRVETEYNQAESEDAELRGVAFVYTTEDEGGTEHTHRTVYEQKDIKKLAREAESGK